jgi:methionyl-tRNA formyltransferase
MGESMSKMKYILLSEKRWHKPMFEQLKDEVDAEWLLIDKKENFTIDLVGKIKPDKIFIPHWSTVIPPEIFNRFECIVFHMTDLPFGRGGSPLQNLISRGYEETVLSALRVEDGIDTGGIYLKKKLMLHGSALEIFLRASHVIKSMIEDLHSKQIVPVAQEGEVQNFKRRTPAQSSISDLVNVEELYNHIRMLDCEGYPAAFFENEHFRFEFSRVNFTDSKTLQADVRIIQK